MISGLTCTKQVNPEIVLQLRSVTNRTSASLSNKSYFGVIVNRINRKSLASS
jgi:hypothetical protein